MTPQVEDVLAKASGATVRPYSTFDFGRERDPGCLSVVVPKGAAEPLVFALRPLLPAGWVAFVGTTYWLGDEKHDGSEVVAGPGDTQFDILRLARTDACNYDLTTDDLIRRLERYHADHGVNIVHAESDTIELDLLRLPSNAAALAEDLYEFCPDIVDQGVGTVEELAESIEATGRVYLWWA
jgi:hypothetical protein